MRSISALLASVFAGAFSALVAPAPAARADVAEAVDGYILPELGKFTAAATALSDQAGTSCQPEALRPAWNAAFDAWLRIGFLHLGPGEDRGLNMAIAFWPDPKGIGAKQQRQLIAAADPVVEDPAAFGTRSVALRGLFALERLLYPAEPLDQDYACALIKVTAQDLARMAREIEAGWKDGFAAQLLTAGQPGNSRFLSQSEARQALFTQLMGGLEFVKDQRLGRPLGTVDRPRPERAEARASERSLQNVAVSLQALSDFAAYLSGYAPQTASDLANAVALMRTTGSQDFAAVSDPLKWRVLQQVQQGVRTARETAAMEVGDALGVEMGFNSADGD